MQITIKQAQISDSSHIAELFDQYRCFYQQKSDISLANDFIYQRLEQQQSVIFYAINDKGEYLAFSQLYPSFSSISAKKTWILNDLYVKPNARKMKIATKLMAAAIEMALETAANGIALETAADNHNAQALYQSLGYQKSIGFEHYFLSLE